MKILVVFFMFFLLEGGVQAKAVRNKKTSVSTTQKSVEQSAKDPNLIVFPGAQEIFTNAKQAILIDFNTEKVLLEKNADERMVPSSMTKMMTDYVVNMARKSGKIPPNTKYLVSQKAWSTQGSKMFVELGGQVSIEDLMLGLAVQSGNDATIVLAEGLMGNEELFAREMTRVAKTLGMNNTQFKNASGLPEEGHYSTARNMAKLGLAMIKNHPEYYVINSIKEFTYHGIKQGNRNPLLYDNMGCDGIKTGHTDDGGYGMVASCTDGNQRYILTVNGLRSMQERADETRKLMAWAKANFTGQQVIKKGDVIEAQAKVEIGKKHAIKLVAANDVNFLMLRSEQNQPVINKSIPASIKAPIAEGAKVGELSVTLANNTAKIDVIAAESVEKLGWFDRALRMVGLK